MRLDGHAMARGGHAFVMDVQSEYTSHLASRMAVPVVPEARMKRRINDLHPVVEVQGDTDVLVTHQMTSLLNRDFGRRVCSAHDYHDEIARALDLLFTGF